MEPMRVHGATNMLLEAYHWVKAHHPYWYVGRAPRLLQAGLLLAVLAWSGKLPLEVSWLADHVGTHMRGGSSGRNHLKG